MPFLYPSTLLISCIALFITICGCNSNQNNNAFIEGTSYSIRINQDALNIASIKVEFVPEDSLLYMHNGAQELADGWGTFVHNLRVYDETGQPIRVTKLDGAKWKMYTALEKKLTLTYDLHLNHESYDWSGGIDGVAYSTELGVFYTGKTLFILNGNHQNTLTVDFELPGNWTTTTPWLQIGKRANAYRVNNHEDLINAMLFAGNHKELSIERNGFELLFALGSPETIVDEAVYLHLAEGVLDYYIELMGGIPNPPPTHPFKKAVVVISSHSTITDGEAIGNNISILIEKEGGQLSKTISRLIFAHEFFHLWNGKSFIPVNETTEWFNEGFTNYYTLKALHHIEYLNDESFVELLSSFFYERYKNDTAVGRVSMTKGEMRHDHWGLVYAGGLFAGIAQDMIIRKATNNEKSLDDLMRTIFHKYGGSHNRYDLEELENMMSVLSGTDQSDFFETYIKGTKRIPIENYLSMAGMNASSKNGRLVLSIKEDLNDLQLQILRGFFGEIDNENRVLSQPKLSISEIK